MVRIRSRTAIPLLALATTLCVAAPAVAADYPAPGKPGAVQKAPKGPFKTLKVCKSGCSFKTIQSAVDKAKAGWTIKVGDGTYKESVKVTGSAKRYLKLIGNVADPSKVVIDLTSLKAPANQNSVLINGANEVTLEGFTTQGYRGNGFFVVNATGYTFADLRAEGHVGVYGIYAFNTIGGSIKDSEARWNNDGGFYIGQTPPQTKPVRTMVSNVTSDGNVVGWSGTNMRYVTISGSRFYNNAVGVAPNALTSEKYPPDEDNVITDNDIFWNNFDYFKGAPFPVRKQAAESAPYPPGIGVIIFGGRRNVIENNRIFGNYLSGAIGVQQLLLEDLDAQKLVGNQVHDNTFGKDGTDLNGRDIFYDGDGSDNCFGPNAGVQVTIPADGSTIQNCPFSGDNALSADAQTTIAGWTLSDPTHIANWIVHPHAPITGLTPLEDYNSWTGTKPS
jgi:hypothetical protein